jgi:apolipoprotein N-acyltransferase
VEPPEHPHLLPFEKRYVAWVCNAQLPKLTASSPGTPEENERVAFGRGLLGCSALWVGISSPWLIVMFLLILTVGTSWSLLAAAAGFACLGMSVVRRRQSKAFRVRSTTTPAPEH